MKYSLSLFILCITWIISCSAILQTNTHTYILGSGIPKILAFHRETGDETLITLPFAPQSMVIHQDNGYVVGPDGHFCIINLLRNEVIRRLTFGSPIKEFQINTYINSGVLIFVSSFCLFDLFTFETKELSYCYFKIDKCHMIDHYIYLAYEDSHTVFRKDLANSDRGFDTLPLLETPNGIYFHRDALYLTSQNFVSIIDLLTWSLTATYNTTNRTWSKIEFQGEYGYYTGFHGLEQCIDLKRKTFGNLADAPPYLENYKVHEGKEYGFHSKFACLLIERDATTHRIMNQLELDNCYTLLAFCQHYIYLTTDKMASILLIERDTFQPYLSLFPQMETRAMTVHKGLGYLDTKEFKIIVLDLTTYKIVDQFPSHRQDLTLSPTSVYLGTQKVREVRKPGFFDDPYEGIHGTLCGDGFAEDHFKAFEAALTCSDYVLARTHLEKALDQLHPKACAIAAYAFFFDKWGAVDPKGAWFKEFSLFMDKSYFFNLLRDQFDIKFTPHLK